MALVLLAYLLRFELDSEVILAFGMFERALALQPGSVDDLTSLSRVEVARASAAAAVARVQAAIASNASKAALVNLLGELYLQQKDVGHASEAFARASTLVPHAWLPHWNLAVAHSAANDPPAAIAEYLYLAMTELQLGHRDRALSNLESALTGRFQGAFRIRTAFLDGGKPCAMVGMLRHPHG
jgi:Flp pilus assembly protein TadD